MGNLAGMLALGALLAFAWSCLPYFTRGLKAHQAALAAAQARVPELAQLGSASSERRRALAARLGPLLEDPDPAVIRGAAHYLQELGSDAAPALPALAARLEREEGVPSMAGGALARIGPEGKAALIAALGSKSYWARSAAAYELGRMGPAAADALPALRAAERRAEQSEKISLGLAIGRIMGAAPQ